MLSIGFGRGLIDCAIAERGPRSHTSVEAHPQVWDRMVADGWQDRATLLRGSHLRESVDAAIGAIGEQWRGLDREALAAARESVLSV